MYSNHQKRVMQYSGSRTIKWLARDEKWSFSIQICVGFFVCLFVCFFVCFPNEIMLACLLIASTIIISAVTHRCLIGLFD